MRAKSLIDENPIYCLFKIIMEENTNLDDPISFHRSTSSAGHLSSCNLLLKFTVHHAPSSPRNLSEMKNSPGRSRFPKEGGVSDFVSNGAATIPEEPRQGRC